ncbi:MAG: hypothetical protein LH468_13545, partial [Nocardioides sp.]|nr:hypothetical protein [Nocardioides sp.]
AAAAAAAAALPAPQGICADPAIVVTPSLPSPVAGADVGILLDLRTRFSPACTWTISPDQLVLKVTSGEDDIWSTQQCPQAVPTQDLVLRRAVSTQVQVVWSARRSDDDCTNRTTWALPGFYHVLVAALAGEPTDLQFELTKPVPAEITETLPPQATGAKQQGAEAKQQQAEQKARSTKKARQG